MQEAAVVAGSDRVFLLYRKKRLGYKSFAVAASEDGIRFQDTGETAELRGENGLLRNLNECGSFRATSSQGVFFMSYTRKQGAKKRTLNIAAAHDATFWLTQGHFRDIEHSSTVVETPLPEHRYLMFFGDKQIHLASSHNLHQWHIYAKPVLMPRPDHFDEHPLEVARARLTDRGIELTYYTKKRAKLRTVYSIGVAVFDPKRPTKCIWRSEGPVWEQPSSWRHAVKPVGVADVRDQTLYYWQDRYGHLFVSLCVPGDKLQALSVEHRPELERHAGNPIISPRAGHAWESKATFNPAAVYENGRVHVMYRAIGDSDLSVLGYASSPDGIHFDERLSDPAYAPREGYEGKNVSHDGIPNQYQSGGTWGGCEDPRLTRIGDRYYMTYVAYNGWNYPRVALTSIAVKDFLAHRWKWKKAVLLSPSNEVHKNWVLFPEKIKGRHALMHSISPDILIEYFDSLEDLEKRKKTIRSRYGRASRAGAWDNWTRGAGSPPIRTDHGWLLFYHAMDVRDPDRYKLGAMLLDIADPTKVLCRSKVPVLAPDAHYENHGMKHGIIYSCGAVIKDKDLLIYYGGADMVSCVARAPIKDFLKKLVMHREPKFEIATVTS